MSAEPGTPIAAALQLLAGEQRQRSLTPGAKRCDPLSALHTLSSNTSVEMALSSSLRAICTVFWHKQGTHCQATHCFWRWRVGEDSKLPLLVLQQVLKKWPRKINRLISLSGWPV